MTQIYIYFSKIPNPLHKVPHFIYVKIKKDFLEKEVFLYNLHYLKLYFLFSPIILTKIKIACAHPRTVITTRRYF